MIEITLDDLKTLYFASHCRCDNCTDDRCEACHLKLTLLNIKKLLDDNGVNTLIC